LAAAATSEEKEREETRGRRLDVGHADTLRPSMAEVHAA
jgi:hypothetical protein